MTAQRKDISDPDELKAFAEVVGDQRRLDYLFCLTVADITATNPELWTSWRATLLRQLYFGTRDFLTRGLESLPVVEYTSRKQRPMRWNSVRHQFAQMRVPFGGSGHRNTSSATRPMSWHAP